MSESVSMGGSKSMSESERVSLIVSRPVIASHVIENLEQLGAS
jgi:hypothetical protein